MILCFELKRGFREGFIVGIVNVRLFEVSRHFEKVCFFLYLVEKKSKFITLKQ